MNEEAVSIYFGLEQGSRADMEVVGRCLIELSEAIREWSFYVEPFNELRVDVVRGIDGSLIVDFVLRFKKKFLNDKKRLSEILFILLCVLGSDVRQYVDAKIFDKMFGGSPQDTPTRDDVTAKLDDIEKNDVGGVHIRNFYGTLNSESHITSVGAAPGHGVRPAIVVPRREFATRATSSVVNQTEQVRVRQEHVTATLVSPVLIQGVRKWKFKTEHFEFTAPILDGEFRNHLLRGETNLKLQAGIEMDMLVSVLESRKNGVWVAKSREITKVLEVRTNPKFQERFNFE